VKKSFPDAPEDEMLAYLRRGLLEKKPADPLLIARTLLGEAVEIYGKGETEKVYLKAIEDYLDGFEMAEPALFAKDAAPGRSLEAQFAQFRTSIRRGVSVAELQKQRLEMRPDSHGRRTTVKAAQHDFRG
jgi:high-affinity iron transporter